MADTTHNTPTSSSPNRPCKFEGLCPERCPNFVPDPDTPRRCLDCAHLASLHIASDQPAPGSFKGRWFSSLQSTRGRRLVSAPQPSISSAAARNEALSGYHTGNISARAVSTQLPPSNKTRKRKLSQVSEKAKPQRNRFGPDEITPVHAIYFVPAASESLTVTRNHAGVNVIDINCTAPNQTMKEQLVAAGYGRRSHPEDNPRLALDPTLTPEDTAAFIATIFPDPYQAYCLEHDRSPNDVAPADWCIQLVKRNRRLKNNSGETGLTTRMLLSNAFMEGGRVLSKEIYLGVNATLPLPEPSSTTKGKGKARVTQATVQDSSSELDTDTEEGSRSPTPKRQKRTLHSHAPVQPSIPPGNSTLADLSPPIAAPAAQALATLSPTPTFIEIGSDSDVEETSFVLAQALSLSEPISMPTGPSGTPPAAGPGPSTLASQAAQTYSFASTSGWGGQLMDPFADDYSI
ncbi:hypothetical protein FRC09_001808 [Ceratobasidium sp. 395]|nr:hypothetical protein FRC09_001808 [Ceratobasidium sp. 395]